MDTPKIDDSDSIPVKKPGILTYNMSSFDGICMNTGNEDYWRKSPDNLPLLKDSDLYTITRTQIPFKTCYC